MLGNLFPNYVTVNFKLPVLLVNQCKNLQKLGRNFAPDWLASMLTPEPGGFGQQTITVADAINVYKLIIYRIYLM